MKNKILIIDDDRELCEEISEILTDEGFEIKTEHDGINGLQCINTNQHNLVLLDLKIPGMSGFEVLKTAKSTHPGLKIIVLSGRPFNREMFQQQTIDDELNILKLADEIISKPYEIETLLSKIHSFLELA